MSFRNEVLRLRNLRTILCNHNFTVKMIPVSLVHFPDLLVEYAFRDDKLGRGGGIVKAL